MWNQIRIVIGVLVVAAAVLVALRFGRGAVYQGRHLSAWTEDFLVGQADTMLRAEGVVYNLRPGDRKGSWSAFTNEVVPHVLRALKRDDNSLWKPYTALSRMAPQWLARQLPRWPEPANVRRMAAYRLGHITSGEPIGAVPALCERAGHDPSAVVRREALESVSFIGADCDEAFWLMKRTLLGNTNHEERILAVEWFGRAAPRPEKAVPVLVEVLQDPDHYVSGEAAMAIAKYGPRAAFAAEDIQRMVITRAEHAEAFFALAHLDARAALQTGSPWVTNVFFAELWRTNKNSSK